MYTCVKCKQSFSSLFKRAACRQCDSRGCVGLKGQVCTMTPGTVIRTNEDGPWLLTEMVSADGHYQAVVLLTGELVWLYPDTFVSVMRGY